MFCAIIASYLTATLTAPVSAVTAVVSSPQVTAPDAAALVLPPAGVSLIAVSGADEFAAMTGTNSLITATGGNEARPIASITKLVTALAILERHPLERGEAGPTITFSRADADLYDYYYVKQASIYSMKRGSSMSLRDALEVILVVSATNYADAVSTWAFGSSFGFRSATRGWLDSHGLTGTTIVEPTGLDPRNTSTPTDLLEIGRLALANPVVAEIVGFSSLRIASGNGSPNTNTLVGVDGITGIKIGTLEQAGACLLFSSTLDVGLAEPIAVIGVILGGDNHYQVNSATRALLSSIRAGFHEVPVVSVGQVLGSYTTEWGEVAELVAVRDESIFTWSDQAVTSTVTAKPLSSGSIGETVGEVTFRAGERTVVVPLELSSTIDGPDGWWRVTHPEQLLPWLIR